MKRFAILPRLLPVDGGMVLCYGNRGVLFGINSLPQPLLRAFGLDRIEVALNPLPRVESLVIFDRDANYVASAQICVDGTRGWMFSINGSRFYEVLCTDLPAILEEAGVTSLEGCVLPGHSRLMRRALRQVGEVLDDGACQMNGHEMEWVVVRSKSQQVSLSKAL